MKKKINIVKIYYSENKHYKEDCDICIIGAGAIGIYLATRLAKEKLSVVLIEAGDQSSQEINEIGFGTKFLKNIYSGATKGRYFGIGGTTSHWGGLLVPHSKLDIKDDRSGIWKYIASVVENNSSAVLNNLNWTRESSFFEFKSNKKIKLQNLLKNINIDLIQSLSIPFRKKNFSNILYNANFSSDNLKVYKNSVVSDWFFEDSNNSVSSISAKSISGNKLKVNAKKFIVSAGALESTRILLEIDEISNHSIFDKSSLIGHYLSDHISLPIATSDVNNIDAIRVFSPYFSHGWMRGFRFVYNSSDIKLPRSFFHFVFKDQNPGFFLVKHILKCVQSRKMLKIRPIILLSGVYGLLKITIYRFIFSRLYFSKTTKVLMQLDIEQTPNIDNYVSLGTEKDKYGRKNIEINWNIFNCDIEKIKLISRQFVKSWNTSSQFKLKMIEKEKLENPYDAYHPVGTCRMGKKNGSVVDKNLRVYGLNNLWIVSTAVLPTAGSANPTFTTLCLAENLVNSIPKA